MKNELLIDLSRQLQFARLSGDFNPLHVDSTSSRRSQFGNAVVHGIHLLMFVFEKLDISEHVCITELKVDFHSAVRIGEPFYFLSSQEYKAWSIRVFAGARLCAVIQVQFDESKIGLGVPFANHPSLAPLCITDYSELQQCQGVENGGFDSVKCQQLFPNLFFYISHRDIDFLLTITRIIGMRCPGEFALFRGFSWKCSEASTNQQVRYYVDAIDQRFRLLKIMIRSSFAHVATEVILRKPPITQSPYLEIQNVVKTNEFRGIRALVIGGSRGLGELTVKALAAGSAEVVFTYLHGSDDAQSLVELTGPNVRTLQFDMMASEPELLAQFEPSHLFYFATPHIEKQPLNSWDEVLYERFFEIYVVKFRNLLNAVKLKGVFFPSSTFVSTNEIGFSEYVRAKVAGEVLCNEWQKSHPDTNIVFGRLPPLVTDQTSIRLGDDTSKNLIDLLPWIRKVAT